MRDRIEIDFFDQGTQRRLSGQEDIFPKPAFPRYKDDKIIDCINRILRKTIYS